MQKEVKFERIKFDVYKRTWRNSKYQYTNAGESSTIKIDDKKEFLDFIKNKFNKLIHKSIPDNSKVFFSKNVVFPRAKFKESYPTCTIVRDQSKADIIIIDKSKIRNNIGSIGSSKFVLLSNSKYISMSEYKDKELRDFLKVQGIEKVKNSRSITVLSSYWSRDFELNNLSDILVTSDSIGYVDVNSLNNTNGSIMDDVAFEKINSMLESRTPDMMNLAIRMLTGYNYEENRFKLSQLIYNHWDSISSYIRKNVDIKAMINKYNKEYGVTRGKRSYYREYPDTRFWFIQLEYYKNEEELSIIQKNLIESLGIDTDIVDISIKRKDEILEDNDEFTTIINIKDDFLDDDDDDE
jgi:hypothetical protein